MPKPQPQKRQTKAVPGPTPSPPHPRLAKATPGNQRPLTPRQAAILNHISDYTEEHGYAPSVRELGDLLGIKTTNGVFDHLKALERKGFISRPFHQARSIVVLKEMDGEERQSPFQKAVFELLEALEGERLSARVRRQMRKVEGMLG